MGKLLEILARRIPARYGLDPIRDVQVLCPMNRGGLGARSLNLELQRLLNPPGGARVERFGWIFGPGDKVMQVENDYDKDVFNGDLGLVRAVDMEVGDVVVDFDGARWPTPSANWTSWCLPMPPRCTRPKGRSTRQW